jgi:hypothetical protein
MRNFHVVVIDDIGQVICWIPIRLQENGVIIYTIDLLPLLLPAIQVLPRGAKHNVVKRRVPISFQPNNMCFAVGGPFFCLLARFVDTLAIVSEGKAGLVALSGKHI